MGREVFVDRRLVLVVGHIGVQAPDTYVVWGRRVLAFLMGDY